MNLPPLKRTDGLEAQAIRADNEERYLTVGSSYFSRESLARGAAVRAWHPTYSANSDSFIYHTYELFDESGRIIESRTEPEELD